MSLPRSNEVTPWVNAAAADTSFVTGVPVLMDERAAIEVVYTGLDAADAYIQLKGSVSGEIAKARNLTDYASTLTTANSSILFNVGDIGYSWLHVVYDAGANTAGSITIDLTRKQKS